MSRFDIFDVILFSTCQKTSTWSELMHKWPIIDNLFRLIWNRSVWPYKWRRRFGHSYSRRKLPVLWNQQRVLYSCGNLMYTNGDRSLVLVIKYYMVITINKLGMTFFTSDSWKNTKATVPAKTVIYICSEMAATDTFVVHYTDAYWNAFNNYFDWKRFRQAGDINIMIIIN